MQEFLGVRWGAGSSCGQGYGEYHLVQFEVNGPAPPPGDYNCDGDVDLDDFAEFPDCMEGPNVTPTPAQECLDAFDLDFDEDVDLHDFAIMQQSFTGP